MSGINFKIRDIKGNVAFEFPQDEAMLKKSHSVAKTAAVRAMLKQKPWSYPIKNLSGLELCEVNFSRRHFESANFNESNLKYASFKGANLHSATFKKARLYATSFVNADLEQAHFYDADLTGADFTGANLGGASLQDAKVNSAIGLIDGGTRSDHYRFFGWAKDGVLQIRAGCRNLSIEEARSFWTKSRGSTALGRETQSLLDNIERLAKIRGMIPE